MSFIFSSRCFLCAMVISSVSLQCQHLLHFLLENLLWCLSKVWKLTDSISVTFWTFKMSFEDTSKNVHFYLASFIFWRIVLKNTWAKSLNFFGQISEAWMLESMWMERCHIWRLIHQTQMKMYPFIKSFTFCESLWLIWTVWKSIMWLVHERL